MSHNPPLMGCGHAANATRDGKPVCVIDIGIHPGATQVVENPDLAGRMAHCSYGPHAKVPSSRNLAFFEYRPNAEEDVYYCGCYGWE